MGRGIGWDGVGWEGGSCVCIDESSCSQLGVHSHFTPYTTGAVVSRSKESCMGERKTNATESD